MVDETEFADLRRQVARQGELIDALYKRLGIGQLDAAGLPVADGSYPDVVDEIRAGNLIGAIKNYRAHTGVGLAEAKTAVEQLARTLGH